MNSSIELQVISKILTSDSQEEIDTLCGYDLSYYETYKPCMEFIIEHSTKYGQPPDPFTFQAQFPDVNIFQVTEPLTYLVRELRKNKERIMLNDVFNKLKELGEGDVSEAWQYISRQCDRVAELDESRPMDIVHDAEIRSKQVQEFANQTRIPTGFPEIDKLMYGGLSTVEELLLIVARTNTGKSWCCTKMMESAQKNGFPVLYYSPEMQASYLGTRFDTWRGHFQNNQLFQGKYSEQYLQYLAELKSSDNVAAYVLEDANVTEGIVNVRNLENFIKKLGIKLVIIDGLSYMEDAKKSSSDYEKYKNICTDLFKLSKKYRCAMVVAVQANRETRANIDDKGESMPSLYNIEGSDHPGRICTQAFALRQIFDKHVLDIRLEKSRNAANQKPILSYAWDVNTGNMQYLPGGDDDISAPNISVPVATTGVSQHTMSSDSAVMDDDFEDDDVEF